MDLSPLPAYAKVCAIYRTVWHRRSEISYGIAIAVYRRDRISYRIASPPCLGQIVTYRIEEEEDDDDEDEEEEGEEEVCHSRIRMHHRQTGLIHISA